MPTPADDDAHAERTSADGPARAALTAEQQAGIDAMRDASYPTRRATVPALEAILYEALPVLDRGFVRVIDYMGDDEAIVQAARVSYGRGTRRSRDDQGLINYLMRNWHTSPFEMCEIKLHVKLPIFVARQWIRHRTASVNEYSARYSVLDNEFYIPTPQYLGAQSQTNRQGREAPQFYQLGFTDLVSPTTKGMRGSEEVLQGKEAQRVLEILREDSERAYEHYEEMLNERSDGRRRDRNRKGLARELARMNLSLNFYTQWYWKTDLHNLMHFLRLRADPHAQYEIRVYADEILKVLERWVPMTYAAFTNYRLGGAQLSAQALEAVRRMLAGETVDAKAAGMSAGEWRELQALLRRDP